MLQWWWKIEKYNFQTEFWLGKNSHPLWGSKNCFKGWSNVKYRAIWNRHCALLSINLFFKFGLEIVFFEFSHSLRSFYLFYGVIKRLNIILTFLEFLLYPPVHRNFVLLFGVFRLILGGGKTSKLNFQPLWYLLYSPDDCYFFPSWK